MTGPDLETSYCRTPVVLRRQCRGSMSASGCEPRGGWCGGPLHQVMRQAYVSCHLVIATIADPVDNSWEGAGGFCRCSCITDGAARPQVVYGRS